MLACLSLPNSGTFTLSDRKSRVFFPCSPPTAERSTSQARSTGAEEGPTESPLTGHEQAQKIGQIASGDQVHRSRVLAFETLASSYLIAKRKVGSLVVAPAHLISVLMTSLASCAGLRSDVSMLLRPSATFSCCTCMLSLALKWPITQCPAEVSSTCRIT